MTPAARGPSLSDPRSSACAAQQLSLMPDGRSPAAQQHTESTGCVSLPWVPAASLLRLMRADSGQAGGGTAAQQDSDGSPEHAGSCGGSINPEFPMAPGTTLGSLAAGQEGSATAAPQGSNAAPEHAGVCGGSIMSIGPSIMMISPEIPMVPGATLGLLAAGQEGSATAAPQGSDATTQQDSDSTPEHAGSCGGSISPEFPMAPGATLESQLLEASEQTERTPSAGGSAAAGLCIGVDGVGAGGRPGRSSGVSTAEQAVAKVLHGMHHVTLTRGARTTRPDSSSQSDGASRVPGPMRVPLGFGQANSSGGGSNLAQSSPHSSERSDAGEQGRIGRGWPKPHHLAAVPPCWAQPRDCTPPRCLQAAGAPRPPRCAAPSARWWWPRARALASCAVPRPRR